MARPWLRRGCFGCLGAVALLAVAGVVVFVVSESAPEERRTAGRDHALPAAATANFDGPIGTIEIDVTGAVLKLAAGEPGEFIHVESDYDANRFELSQSMDVEGGDGTWTYRLGFKRKKHFGFFGRGWSGNRLHVVLPRDVPIRIVADVSTAESEFDLGGLTLVDVELQFSAGHHDVTFREPLARPLDTLAVEGRGVELALLGIGNASPRRMDVEQRAGKFILDLRGQWSTDGEIHASCRVGEIDVQLPENVRLAVDGDLTVPATVGVVGAQAVEVALPEVRAHFDSRLCRERQRVR